MEKKETEAPRSMGMLIIEARKKLLELLDMFSSLQTPNNDSIILQSTTQHKGESEKKVHQAAVENLEDVERVTCLPIIPLPGGRYLCTCQQCDDKKPWVARSLPPPRCANTEFRHTRWWFRKLDEGEDEPYLPVFLRRIVARIPQEKRKAKRDS